MPGGIEIERDVGIDRVGIAKLPLQRAGREQPARAARRKQQRHRLGTEIDRIGAIAPQSGLGRDVRDVAAPRIGHRLDAGRAHDQARRIDLRGRFGNLDLRALKIAELGAIIGRGAMPRDIDIVVQTGLGVAQRNAGQHDRETTRIPAAHKARSD